MRSLPLKKQKISFVTEKRAKPESQLAPSPLRLKVRTPGALNVCSAKKLLCKEVLFSGDQGQAEIKVDAPESPYLHKLQ